MSIHVHVCVSIASFACSCVSIKSRITAAVCMSIKLFSSMMINFVYVTVPFSPQTHVVGILACNLSQGCSAAAAAVVLRLRQNRNGIFCMIII